MSRKVYLDHNASTPVHPDVVAEMVPYFHDVFGNPSSIDGFGRPAREAEDVPREAVGRYLAVAAALAALTATGTRPRNYGERRRGVGRGRGDSSTSQRVHRGVGG